MISGRRHNGFGATPTYHSVNRLLVPEVAMRVNRKDFFHQILAQGQWTVKKLNFSMGDAVTLRCRVTGVGMGYLYASYNNGADPSLLVIKKVTAGFHDIQFKVPYPMLKDFKVGISTTVPKGYTIDRLSREDRYKINTNSMMISQSTPMYESPGIGFGGLGAAVQDHTGPARGGQDSNNNSYWDGNWTNFTWQNGFTGDRDVGHTNEASPQVYGEYHGYYANRMSYAIARFDVEDRFLGWDMVEKKQFTLPAGVPMCVVMQFFVLPKQTDDGGNKSGAADREMQTPYWHYAHDYQIPANGFHLLDDDWDMCRRVKSPAKFDRRYDKDSKGVIKNVPRATVVSTEYENCGYLINGEYKDAKDIAAKLEWYNETTSQWSAPSVAPQFIPKTNQDGFTKVIFRVPRQLDPIADKDMVSELSALGVDYLYNTTKQCYPYPVGELVQGKRNINSPINTGYSVIGRPTATNTKLEYEDDGVTYYGTRKVKFGIYFTYGNHPYAGVAGNDRGGPKPGVNDSYLPSMYFSDPEKMARMNYPELLNAFYPVGGFETGGVVIAIAKGMSTETTYVLRNSSSGSTDGVFRNKTNPASDGSRIGTKQADVLPPTGIILTSDLEDDRAAVGEESLLAAWKAKFGLPLTAGFFSEYGFKDQDPDKPTHYKTKDPDSGLWIQAPYQIVYFKIPPEYAGPYVDYEIVTNKETDSDGKEFNVTKLQITQPEGKRFALGKGDSLWLHCRTPYGKHTKQNIDIIEEVDEQRVMIELGLTEEETFAYNLLNNAPAESTAEVATIQQEEDYLKALARMEDGSEGSEGSGESGDPDIKLPRGAKYIRSGDRWRLNPKHYARESQLKDAGFLGGIKSTLGGFTDPRDFYVEDVTQKWGASSRSGLGAAGLGNAALDYMFDYDPEEFVSDNLEDIGDVLQDALYATAYGAGALLELPIAAKQTASGDFTGAYESTKSSLTKSGTAILNAGSLPFSTADLGIKLPLRVTRVGTSATIAAGAAGADLVEDMVGLGAISYRGLGESTADKLERYGENTTSFFKGTAKGIIPDKIQEGFGDSIDALVGSYNKHPIAYTALAFGSIPLLIPGIGGAYARNLTTVASAAIGLVPATFRAAVDTVGNVASGAIDESKRIGNSIATSPSKRGTAARRRRNKRR